MTHKKLEQRGESANPIPDHGTDSSKSGIREKLTAAELIFVEGRETDGLRLSDQQISLGLEQMRQIGEL